MEPDTHSEPPAQAPVRDEGLRCLKCDYNLTGLPSGLCPECGQVFDVDELRRELTGGVLRPVPIWDEPQRFGRPEAFVRTVLEVWFRPDRFASTFPRTCSAKTPVAFSLTCHALAYFAGLGLACLPALDESTHDLSIYVGLVICIPIVAIMAHLCELVVAAGPFALAGAGPCRRYRFRTVRCMLRFTTCHLIVTCVAVGSYLALGMARQRYASDVFWPVFGTSVVLWWLDLSIMLVTLGRRTVGVVLGILLIPIIGVAAGLLGLLGVGMLFDSLR